MDYLYTKIIVIITAILFCIYIYARYVDKYSVIYYERKVNYFYYTHKLAIFLFFMLLIIGYVFYRIEKSNKKDRKIIKNYGLLIDMLSTKVPIIGGDEKSEREQLDIIKQIKDNLKPKLKELYEERQQVRLCNIKNRKIQCEIKYVNVFTDDQLEDAINTEIKFLEYTTSNYALRNALKSQNYKLAIDIILDQLEELYPNITLKQLGVALSDAAVAGFRNQHPAFGLGNLFSRAK
jgi:hypothetical protein